MPRTHVAKYALAPTHLRSITQAACQGLEGSLQTYKLSRGIAMCARCGQRLQRHRRNCAPRGARRDAAGVSGVVLQGGEKAIVFAGLIEEIVGANQLALTAIFGVGIVRKHVDARSRRKSVLAQLAHDLDAISFLEPDVRDDHVRLGRDNSGHRRALLLRKADDIETAQGLKVLDDALADKRRILDDKDAYERSHWLRRCISP